MSESRSVDLTATIRAMAANPESIATMLGDVLRGMQRAEAAAITAGLALAQMNVDQSDDVESVVRNSCADELTAQIEHLEAAIQAVEALAGRVQP